MKIPTEYNATILINGQIIFTNVEDILNISFIFKSRLKNNMCSMLYLKNKFGHISLQTNYFKWLSIIYKINPGKKINGLIIKTLFISLDPFTHIQTHTRAHTFQY